MEDGEHGGGGADLEGEICLGFGCGGGDNGIGDTGLGGFVVLICGTLRSLVTVFFKVVPLWIESSNALGLLGTDVWSREIGDEFGNAPLLDDDVDDKYLGVSST